MNLLKIDTILLDKLSPLITVVVILFMVFIVGRCLFGKDIAKAVFSLILCSFLLWVVNDINGFVGIFDTVEDFSKVMKFEK